MEKIKSLDDLKKLREGMQAKIKLRESGNNAENIVRVKVSMSTCGIASGAKEIMNFMMDEMERQAIEAVVTQTGCMGYCYAEPTIEVTVPGHDPIVFGDVDKVRASEIIEKYIIHNELVEGILPVNYRSIDI
ncbi:MAG: (2Fe-2S) ferredoxin domain-containing protein [Marinilabiliales bacterium]|nr:(2Fe-2S) ferredoxin domain-containing protein [Marinilabiliales bacterium]